MSLIKQNCKTRSQLPRKAALCESGQPGFNPLHGAAGSLQWQRQAEGLSWGACTALHICFGHYTHAEAFGPCPFGEVLWFSPKSSCHIPPLTVIWGKLHESQLPPPVPCHMWFSCSIWALLNTNGSWGPSGPFPLHWRGLNQDKAHVPSAPSLCQPLGTSLLPHVCHAISQHASARARCHRHAKQCRRLLFPGGLRSSSSSLAPSKSVQAPWWLLFAPKSFLHRKE